MPVPPTGASSQNCAAVRSAALGVTVGQGARDHHVVMGAGLLLDCTGKYVGLCLCCVVALDAWSCIVVVLAGISQSNASSKSFLSGCLVTVARRCCPDDAVGLTATAVAWFSCVIASRAIKLLRLETLQKVWVHWTSKQGSGHGSGTTQPAE